MQISARNQLQGTVTSVETGPIGAKVKVDVGGGNSITSTITAESVMQLGIVEGDTVTVVIKASDVLIGK